MLFPRRSDNRIPIQRNRETHRSGNLRRIEKLHSVPENLRHRPVWRGWRRRCICGLAWPCIDRNTGTAPIPHQPPTPPKTSGGTAPVPRPEAAETRPETRPESRFESRPGSRSGTLSRNNSGNRYEEMFAGRSGSRFGNRFRDRPVGRAVVRPAIVTLWNSGTPIPLITGNHGITMEPHWAGRTGPWYGNAGLLTLGQAARIGGPTR